VHGILHPLFVYLRIALLFKAFMITYMPGCETRPRQQEGFPVPLTVAPGGAAARQDGADGMVGVRMLRRCP
jgi:hypothetical protein